MQRVFLGRFLPRVISALLAAHDLALAPFGITCRQGVMLVNCALGEAQTPAELARFQALDLSTVTRMVDRLCKKGLLKRTRDRKDRRRVLVTLTPEGRVAIDAALPVSRETALQAWHGVTAEEIEALQSLMRKIMTNLGQDTSIFDPPTDERRTKS
jgi:DNA-binding MarR family transcriptional regulator